MNKYNHLSFAGQTIDVGLDAHKTNWRINARMDGMEIACLSQNPDTSLFKRHSDKNYPGAKIRVVYEAGFCGFGRPISLKELGIECIVVNAADVPTTDKERKRKDDKRDARKLCQELVDGKMKAVYVPDPSTEHARSLVRQHGRLIKDQTRCKNRIKHLLMFRGLVTKSENERWSQKYIKELLQLDCGSQRLKSALYLAIEEYQHIRKILKEAVVLIKKLSTQEFFASGQKYLQSIDGIGLINGMVIQTEIQDICRFKTLDSLCSYAGFVSDISSSNDIPRIKGITRRRNEFLREAIIESSWMLIRKDPAMLMKYKE